MSTTAAESFLWPLQKFIHKATTWTIGEDLCYGTFPFVSLLHLCVIEKNLQGCLDRALCRKV